MVDQTPEQKAALAALAAIELPDPDDKDADKKWKGLAKALGPTYKLIASGQIAVDAGQRQVLQSIMDRAYGKVGQQKNNADHEAGVVVLPVLGDGSKSTICPVCKSKV